MRQACTGKAERCCRTGIPAEMPGENFLLLSNQVFHFDYGSGSCLCYNIQVLGNRGFKSRYKREFELQVDKVIQLYETMETRHSTMIVGPTGGGKTVIIDTLATAHKVAFDEPVKLYPINPKAQTTNELYGTLGKGNRVTLNSTSFFICLLFNMRLPYTLFLILFFVPLLWQMQFHGNGQMDCFHEFFVTLINHYHLEERKNDSYYSMVMLMLFGWKI